MRVEPVQRGTSWSTQMRGHRVVALAGTALALAGAVLGLALLLRPDPPPVEAPRVPPPGVLIDGRPVEQALATLRRAWAAEYEGLRRSAQRFAAFDDMASFLRRPNVPYVDARFPHSRLTDLGLDTLLIVDAERQPVFWRRVGDATNRGFPDAEDFLAGLPAFGADDARGRRGEPVLEGIVRWRRGPSLVVIAPVFAPGEARPPGYVLAARPLDAATLRRVEEQSPLALARLAADDPRVPAAVVARIGDVPNPVLATDAEHVRGWLPVLDARGRLLLWYATSVPRPLSLAPPEPGGAPPERPSRWPAALAGALLLGGALLAAGSALRGTRSRAARRAASAAVSVTDVAADGATDGAAGSSAGSATDELELDDVDLVDDGLDELREAARRGAAESTEPAAPESAAAGPTDAQRVEIARLARMLAQEAGDDGDLLDAAATGPAPVPHARAAEALVTLGATADEPPVPDWLRPPSRWSEGVAAEPGPAAAQGPDVAPDTAAAPPTATRVVRYRPEIRLATGEIGGVVATLEYEAPAADEPGSAAGIADDEWLLRRACSDRHAWLREVGRSLPVGVPVTHESFVAAGFVDRVHAIVAETGLPPAYVELVLPESALVDVGGPGIAALEAAYRAGFSLAIGGLTASSATLAALTRVPVGKLRLAPALVAALPEDAQARAVLDALLAVGRTLDVAVVAEGVDEPTAAQILERRRCPLASGRHYGRAMDADRFLQLLQGSGVETVQLPLMDADALEAHARAAGIA